MKSWAPKALVASLGAADIEKLLREIGYDVVCISDGARALEMCGNETPDAVIADGILPGLDGFALAKRIRGMRLVRMPGIVVMHLPGMGRPLDIPGAVSIEKPISAEMLSEALAAVELKRRVPDAAYMRRLNTALDELGVPEHTGRDYLATAAFLAGEDSGLVMQLTQRLYPMVAARFQTDANGVERAMRRVIDEAWRFGNMENQYRIFKNTIDAARGKPTCGGMIAQLTELMRREG